MSKRYEVVITEFVEEKTLTKRSYEKGVNAVSEEYPEGYGYTEQVPQIESVKREVFKQNTDSISLVDVIKAVNGIKS